MTRSRTSKVPLSRQRNLDQVGAELLNTVFPSAKDVRLLGVSLSLLSDNGSQTNRQNMYPSDLHQLLLFETPGES
jgi:hypothetical protein